MGRIIVDIQRKQKKKREEKIQEERSSLSKMKRNKLKLQVSKKIQVKAHRKSSILYIDI